MGAAMTGEEARRESVLVSVLDPSARNSLLNAQLEMVPVVGLEPTGLTHHFTVNRKNRFTCCSSQCRAASSLQIARRSGGMMLAFVSLGPKSRVCFDAGKRKMIRQQDCEVLYTGCLLASLLLRA